MPTNWSFNLFDLQNSANISNYVINVTVIDVGSGEIPSMVITLNAKNGQFITSTSGEYGTVRVFDQFDRLVIDLAADASDSLNSYNKTFFVDKIVPIFNTIEGNRLELHCLGLERYLQMIHFSKQYYFKDAFSVMSDLAAIYNFNKGSLQALISHNSDSSSNFLPNWTANNYDFEVAERSVYDAMMDVIDQLGSPVAQGGASDFFELYFPDDPADANFNTIQLKAFSSGINPTNPALQKIITSTLSVNVGETQGGIESAQGSLVAAWGADDQGSFPPEFSQWRGIDEAFHLYPVWSHLDGSGNVVSYPQNAIVQYDIGDGNGLQVYTSNVPNNISTPPTNWTKKHEFDFLGSLKYSPWTDGQAIPWKNSAADPTNSFLGQAMYDGNMVVQDGTYYRTEVDMRAISDASIPTSKKMLDGSFAFTPYGGFRILVDTTLGALSGVFAQNGGNDRFGNPYANAIVQNNGAHTGTYQDWDCLITNRATPGGLAITLQSNFGCAVINESKVYIYASPSWHDYTAQNAVTQPGLRVNDCFHPYFALTNDVGVDSTPKSGGGTYGDTSAINVTYKYFALPALITITDANYYSVGCWLDLAMPFPITTDNGYGAGVGGIYGGQAKSPQIPVTIDSVNMSYDRQGNTGFNNAESWDLGPLSALAFQLKLQWLDGTGSPMLEGNFKMRCLLYDTSDNVVSQDFVIPFNNMWADIQLPLNGFQIYRARVPLKWGAIQSIIPVQALNILNVFQWKNIKRIVIQTQESYDDQGRYSPEFCRYSMNVGLTTLINPATLSMWVDAFRFVKPLLAITPRVTDRNLEPTFLQRQNISNYTQLLNDALSMKQIYQFRHKEYEITTMGECDIRFGDSFFYRDSNIVSDSDLAPDGISANTIKLVAKRVTYKIDKTTAGTGGFLRTVLGVRRYNA